MTQYIVVISFALLTVAAALPPLIGISQINSDELIMNDADQSLARAYAKNMMGQQSAALAWYEDNPGYVGIIPEGAGNLDDYFQYGYVPMLDWTSEVRSNGFLITYPTSTIPSHVNGTRLAAILSREYSTPFAGQVSATGIQTPFEYSTTETFGLTNGTPVIGSPVL